MTRKRCRPLEKSDPLFYQIRIKGHLGRLWQASFEGMTITLEENGDTLLAGPVVDQAALYGLLERIRDLNLKLISVSSGAPSTHQSTEEIQT